MSELNLDEIRARCEAATKGPWEATPFVDCDGVQVWPTHWMPAPLEVAPCQ